MQLRSAVPLLRGSLPYGDAIGTCGRARTHYPLPPGGGGGDRPRGSDIERPKSLRNPAMSQTNTLEVDGERLWMTLERSAQIGRFRDTGLQRLTLSREDKEMRDLYVSWVRDAGCAIEIDGVGNIFARRPGRDNSLPPVAIGSHLDTQICGGRYDGILGVLCGLEVVRTLNDRGLVTKRGIEVICWTNEEGGRFAPPMMGSMAFAGVLPLKDVLATADDDGIPVEQALDRIGYAGAEPL